MHRFFEKKVDMLESKSEILKNFSLPFLERILGSDYKKWAWIIDEESIRLFIKSRDGQGFALFLRKSIENNKQCIKIYFNDHVYNKDDGLAREDKYGKPINDYIFSPACISASGVGIIHRKGVKKIIQKEFQQEIKIVSHENKKEKMTSDDIIQNLIKTENGLIMAGGLIKGAESQNPADYDVIILKSNLDHIKPLIMAIRESFQLKKDKPFDLKKFESEFKLDKNKKKLIILIQNDQKNDEYEVYYLQNRIFVPSPYQKEKTTPIISSKGIEDTFEEKIVNLSLKALKLDQRVYIRNKSASQNNHSVLYSDFKNDVMYFDHEKYLLDNEGNLVPEAPEWGSFFDLRRSIPMLMMIEVAPKIFGALGLSEDEITQSVAQQKKNWSSWSEKFEYEKVVNDFVYSSSEEKIARLIENIHITFHLYLKTLEEYLYARDLAQQRKIFIEKEKIAYNDKKLDIEFPYLKTGFKEIFQLNEQSNLIDRSYIDYLNTLEVNFLDLIKSIAKLGKSKIDINNKNAPKWLKSNFSFNEILEKISNEQQKLDDVTRAKVAKVSRMQSMMKSFDHLKDIQLKSISRNVANLMRPKMINNDVFIGLLENIQNVYSHNEVEKILKKILKPNEELIIKNALCSGLFDLAQIISNTCEYPISRDLLDIPYKEFVANEDVINLKKFKQFCTTIQFDVESYPKRSSRAS